MGHTSPAAWMGFDVSYIDRGMMYQKVAKGFQALPVESLKAGRIRAIRRNLSGQSALLETA